jgi:hypothetical protein
MGSPMFLFFIWIFLVTLIAGAMAAIAYALRSGKLEKQDGKKSVRIGLSRQNGKLDSEGAFREIAKLRDGGEFNDCLIENLSAEERALFEIALIDALTEWPRDDQHKIRSALIKHGYDEQCARRLMKDAISSSVRASTLLALLRPQSRTASQQESDRARRRASG